jgi:hypothetical protein
MVFFEYGINYMLWLHDGDNDGGQLKSMWFHFVKDKLCFLESLTEANLQCVADWNYWFELGRGDIEAKFYAWQVTLLLTCYFFREY